MCRLLGIVAAEPYEYGLVLRDAPRSMEVLSQEHSDGWGVATHMAEEGSGWRVRRSSRCACNDGAFLDTVAGARGRVVIAHVRQKSVGTVHLENTHPFQQGNWAFAHNGTINDVEYLLTTTSSSRLKQVRGSTDSEVFFAWLLTRFDEAGVTADADIGPDVDQVLLSALRSVIRRPNFGTANFMLSNGSILYAHRFGRELFLLDRSQSCNCAADGVLGCPSAGPGLRQRRCIALASEPITEEPWEPVAQGGLLRVESSDPPSWKLVV